MLMHAAADKVILKPLRELGGILWSKTRGTVRVDLVRPTIAVQQAGDNVFFTRRRAAGRQPVPRRGGMFMTRANGYDEDEARAGYAGGWLGGSFKRLSTLRRTGARFKVMRHMDVGPRLTDSDEPGRRMFDVGLGINFELDSSAMQPVARLKFLDAFSLKLVPRPAFKFQRSWDLGVKGLAVRASYEVPLECVDTFWAPPARLMVRLDNAAGAGIHFTDGGMEFDERVVASKAGTILRASGGIRFPRELPLEQGNLFSLYVRRLGLKTQW